MTVFRRYPWRRLKVGSSMNQDCYYCQKIIPARTAGTFRRGGKVYGVAFACKNHLVTIG